jgi:hypothetical protein
MWPYKENVAITEKNCSKCRTIKPVSEFSRNKQVKDGYHSWCRACSSAYKESLRQKRMKDGKCSRCGGELDCGLLYCKSCSTQRKIQGSKESTRKVSRESKAKRLVNDIQFKLGSRLRIRLSDALKGRSKPISAVRDLGCTIDELKKHL